MTEISKHFVNTWCFSEGTHHWFPLEMKGIEIVDENTIITLNFVILN
jgi:hypothetical protein